MHDDMGKVVISLISAFGVDTTFILVALVVSLCSSRAMSEK